MDGLEVGKVLHHPVVIQNAVAAAHDIVATLATIKRTGDSRTERNRMLSLDELNELVGLERYDGLGRTAAK